MVKKNYEADLDAGLGLIFRLNKLWPVADINAQAGEYEKWDHALDCIYRNLLYRNSTEVIRDEVTNEIKDIKLKPEDREEYEFLSKIIFKWRRLYQLKVGLNISEETKKKLHHSAAYYRSKWYQALQMKDIWIRKFMKELNLYLKESIKSPGTALFGTFGQKKGR